MRFRIMPKGNKTTVRVEGDGEPFEFTADSVKDAHKLIKQGRKDGWDSVVKPAKAPVKGRD